MKSSYLLSISLLITIGFACKKESTVNPTSNEVTISPPNELDNHPIAISSDWFDISYDSSGIYILEEPSSSEKNVSYLIIGNNNSLMYDTGTGENPEVNNTHIKYLLDSITTTPIELLLSHFHYDHSQNIDEFDYVIFPELNFLQASIGIDSIYNFTSQDLSYGSTPSSVKINEWIALNTEFGIGGKSLKIISTPGHSRESITLIDLTNEIAFLGDFLYNDWLIFFDNQDLSAAIESIDLILSQTNSNYKLFGAHGSPEVNYDKLYTYRDFLSCILSGNCTGTDTQLFGSPCVQYTYQGMTIILFQ